MSLEDLEQAQLLLPREQWGTHDIHTHVAKLPLLVSGALVLLSAAMMYAGNGGWLTWVGLALFFAVLTAFTWVSLRGIR